MEEEEEEEVEVGWFSLRRALAKMMGENTCSPLARTTKRWEAGGMSEGVRKVHKISQKLQGHEPLLAFSYVIVFDNPS